MLFYGGLNLKLRKHQVKHVLKVNSGIQPMRFVPINPKTQITLNCKSEQLHMQHHVGENFQPLVLFHCTLESFTMHYDYTLY